MSKQINDLLYTAKWNLQESIKDENYGKHLDIAHDLISQAKADSITQEFDEPERPNKTDADNDEQSALELQTDKVAYTIPEYNIVKGAKFKKRGHFRTTNGQPDGGLTHYAVCGMSEQSAMGVVKYLAKKGLGAIVISGSGKAFIAEDFDPQRDVVYHAGTSAHGGRKGMSQYLAGLEFCSLGKLNSKNRHKAWKIYTYEKDVDNVKAGEYEALTPAQEAWHLNWHVYQMMTNKAFKIENCIGHHECAPTRKTDIGGSLSYTMPEFRAMLKLRI